MVTVEVLSVTNEVVLEGALVGDPTERELKSGERIWMFQVAAPRVSEPGVDWLDCSVREGRLLRAVSSWTEGDVVRVEGHLRRRFFHVAGGSRSVVELTAQSGRRVKRGSSA